MSKKIFLLYLYVFIFMFIIDISELFSALPENIPSENIIKKVKIPFYSSNKNFFPSGYREPTKQEQTIIDQFTIKVDGIKNKLPNQPRVLPAQIKNYLYLPTIRTQILNNCGAYAPSYYYKTYQEAREHGWIRPDVDANPERIMSPGFTYPLTNNGIDNGAVPSLVMSVICRFGIATWQDMPESINYLAYPTEQVWRSAIPYRGEKVIEFDCSTDSGIQSIKAHLAGGDLAVFACKLYLDVHYPYGSTPSGTGWDNYVIYANGSSPYISHAFTLIGYDDTRTYNDGTGNKTGAFLAVNSWGQEWGAYDADIGTKGCVWFGYDYFKYQRGETKAWAMTDRIAYVPKDLAVFSLSHERMPELTVNLLAGQKSSPLGRLWAFPNNSGLRAISGTFVIDATELNAPVGTNFWLEVSDLYLDGLPSTALGKITSFTIQRPDGIILPSTDIPMDTIDDKTLYLSAGLLSSVREPFSNNIGGFTMAPANQAITDYDLDGDLDIVISGAISTESGVSVVIKLYQNDGTGIFTDSGIVFPPLSGASMAWGDYNKDTFPDLALMGYNSSLGTYITKLYRNYGDGRLIDSNISLPTLGSGSSLAWGYYDNDGDLDLALSGPSYRDNSAVIMRNDGGTFTNSGIGLPQDMYMPFRWVDINNDGWLDYSRGANIYRNNGDGTFTFVKNLFGEMYSDYVWGDYNNDGLMDVAITAISHLETTEISSRIYRNDGNFNFTNINAGLTNVFGGAAAWGDFNNDGYLDLAICGSTRDDYQVLNTSIYIQNPPGSFFNIGASLPNLCDGKINWADVDNDGDIDLIACGEEVWSGSGSMPFVSAIWRNFAANSPGGNHPNTIPNPPITLIAAPDNSNRSALLTWSQSTDTETPPNGLYYDLRVGRNSGGCEIVSPSYVSPFLGMHSRPMTAATSPERILKNLYPGKYYWSVYTIDTGLRTSAWSEEKVFDITPQDYKLMDVNNDKIIDTADIVRLVGMINRILPLELWRADFNIDNRVSIQDINYIKTHLLGFAAPGTEVEKTIGSEGGSISISGLELYIPPNTFPDGPANIKLSYSLDKPPLNEGTCGPLYRVDGMPINTIEPIKIRIRDSRISPDEPPLVAIGENVFLRTWAGEGERYRILKATTATGGNLEFEIPPLDYVTTVTASRNIVKSGPSGYFYHFSLSSLTGHEIYEGAHFAITFPKQFEGTPIENLATYLEEGYQKFSSSPLNFSYSRRTRWPIDVCVGKSENEAECVSSTWGNNYTSLLINQNILNDPATLRRTSNHEFFHLIQGLYDPRNRVAAATIPSMHYWFDEAAATWSEHLFVDNPSTYVPEVYNSYKYLAFNGINQAFKGLKATPIARYGYGMAGLIVYMEKQQNSSSLVQMYDRIFSKTNILFALEEQFENQVAHWYTGFITEYILGKIFTFGLGDLSSPDVCPTTQQFNVKSDKDRSATFKTSITDISAKLYLTQLNNPTMKDDETYQIKLTSDVNFDLNVINMAKTGTVLLGMGQYEDGETRFSIPNLKQLQDAKSRIVILLTNKDHYLPYDNPREYTLDCGITRDGDFPFRNFSYTAQNIIGASFPVFNITSLINANGVGRLLDENVVDLAGSTYQQIRADLWGKRPLSANLTYSASLQSSTCKIIDPVVGGWTTITVDSVKKYKLRKYDPLGNPIETVENTTGAFDLVLGIGEDHALYVLQIIYDAKIDLYNISGELINSHIATNLNAISFVFSFNGK